MSLLNKVLYIIYFYAKSPEEAQEQSPFSYFIYEALRENEEISCQHLKKSYRLEGTQNAIGPFQNLEELRAFCSMLAKDLHLNQVFMISLEEFNKGLVNTTHASDIRNIFYDLGTHIDLAKKGQGSSNLLSRFFKNH